MPGRKSPATTTKLLNSHTLSQLSQLLAYLPRQRLRGLVGLLLLSLLVGLFDLVFVGLLARLVGAISGSRLADKIPNIFVFGGGRADQGLWIAALLIGIFLGPVQAASRTWMAHRAPEAQRAELQLRLLKPDLPGAGARGEVRPSQLPADTRRGGGESAARGPAGEGRPRLHRLPARHQTRRARAGAPWRA